jgi:tetratricopeptide (TPR) repeat protein
LTCGPCKEFDEAVAGDPQMQNAIDGNVVLCILNGTEGEAGEVSKLYSVYKRPSFVLTNATGETMDRWSWYADVGNFQESLEKALVEPMTVSERFAQFREEPSEKDAAKIAAIRHHESLFGEAITWYRRAQALNPASDLHYESEIFDCYAYGTMFHMYEPEDLKAQADLVFNSPQSDDKDLMRVVYAMAKTSGKIGDVAMYTPYLKMGYERTVDSTHEKVVKMREHVAADYALLVQEDEAKAIELKKEAQPDNWREDANALNNFAWWCFERKVNLDEAADLAQKGIELAEPGRQKANIYDTLAEICNLSGDCGKAVDLIRLAVAEDPENEYFQKQLVRFEETLLAEK